jgi:hypothetical protein
MTVESAQVYRGVLPAARAGQGEPRQPGRDGSADRRIEPQRTPTGLARVPNSDDLLRVGVRLTSTRFAAWRPERRLARVPALGASWHGMPCEILKMRVREITAVAS